VTGPGDRTPPGSTPALDTALDAAGVILRRLEADGYAGPDPYDALNATRVPRWVPATAQGRQLLTQAVKRSPWDLRGALGVPAGVSAYTLGHVLLAQSRLSAKDRLPDADATVRRAEGMLERMALPGFSGTCWGYHFDVQTRFFFYAKTTPNVVVTAFAAKGLAAVTDAGFVDGRDAVAGACDFILGDLPRVTDDRGQSFGYIPGSDTVVHNANMLAALTLTLGARLGGKTTLLDEALSAARFTVAYQRDDGAWPYSEQADARWVDGFHTGFVLEGLDAVARATGDGALARAFDKGLTYYLDHFFEADGAPRYYDDRAYPYDALSAAQAIEVLARHAGDDARCRETLARVARWTVDNLVGADGGVGYQVTSRGTDSRHFPRWSAAPVCSALAGVEVI
jgi:hypothetical protein